MKLRRLFAGMAAAVIAASTLAIGASAKSLYDAVDPESDAYYSIGAMGFYMSNQWKWNESEWFGITEDGTITVEYSINEVLTDTTMSGKGNLGDMGIMICNLPEEGYPYDMKVTEATFTPKGGDPITLQSVLDIKAGYHDAETGVRIHIRPTDNVDESGNVIVAATPEVAGWDQEGSFKGGVLKISVDFKNAPACPEVADQVSPAGAAEGDAPAAETTEGDSAPTGAAAGGVLALAVCAATVFTVSKVKK